MNPAWTRIAASAVIVAISAGCSIREDSAPRPIPETETEIFGASATGEDATGDGRIYLLIPAQADAPQQLRSVRRTTPATPFDLLTSLLNGPNRDELAVGLSTAIPDDLIVLATTKVGTRLTIDLSNAITELSVVGQQQALAQIIATATSIEQVEQVRVLVDGEIRTWPIGNGDVVDRPLRVYDYSGFIETSQPSFPTPPG